MKKLVFLSLIAGITVFTACSEAKLDSSTPAAPEVQKIQKLPEAPVFQPVANPDLVVSSKGNTLYSSFPATRANLTPQEEAEVKQPGVEVNLSACTANSYKASKLTVHVRTENDVTVFIPVEASLFAQNDANSLAILMKNGTNQGVYGQTEETLDVDGNPVNVKIQFVSGGVNVVITGVNQQVVGYLDERFHDGLTVEVWNYYKEDADLDALKDGFNAGATVSFSQNPGVYTNAFAKIADYLEMTTAEYLPRIYTQKTPISSSVSYYAALGEEKSSQTPFLDKDFTQPLDAKYWVRPAKCYWIEETKQEIVAPSQFYLLRGHKNPYDCTVTPVGVTVSKTLAHDANIPEDVEEKVYSIAGNYNVYYICE